MKIVCIVGRPGSGKTHLAKTHYSNYLLIDDPETLDELNFLLAKTTKDVVITDPYLCKEENRWRAELFLTQYGDVEFVYFEDDLEKCKVNARRRDLEEGRELYTMPELFDYELPDIETIKIWSEDDI